MSKETSEVVEFLLALGEAAALSLEDGDVSISDAAYFFDCVRQVGAAVDDASKIPEELAAWSAADTEKLNKIAADFNIPQEKIEDIVKDAIKIAGPLIEFIAKFKSE